MKYLLLVGCLGCVEAPTLARDNPCDPAVDGQCGQAVVYDAQPDAVVRDAALDGAGDGSPADLGPDGADGAPPECADAMAEACNGLDDDCDGEIDELAPVACYSGPVETRNVGACRTGVIECVDARWSVCTGAVLPEPERCDRADNDCDGITDEQVACE